MTQLLLLGKNGQLGWELQRTLACLGKLTALDYPTVDFTQPESLAELVQNQKPDVIINAAAYTAVDRAESEPDRVNLINTVAPGVLAESAKKVGAAFIHFSTDYVFDGTNDRPYIETDATNPLNVYGQSKLNGEKRVEEAGGAWLTCRTTWVYSLREGGFVKKVLSWAKEKETLRIVEDQIGGPTSSRMLAEAIALLLSKANGDVFEWLGQRRGLYHLAGDGYTSRFEWAKAILALAPKLQSFKVKEILPAASEDFPTPAQRPAFSALNCDQFARTFGLRLPDWREGLQLMMASA